MPAAELALPACRHRGEALPTGHYPCASPRLVVCGEGVSPAFCAACPVADKEGLASGDPAPPAPLPPLSFRPRPLCLHLGPVTDRLGCLCQGKWVRRCEKVGTTSLDYCNSGVCPHYEEDGG